MNFTSPLRGSGSSALSVRSFRRLWIAGSLSSLGDWLSLLALTALAYDLTGERGAAASGAAVGGVWLTSLFPALVLGPVAGAVADRFDRRMNMIVGDVLRAALYLSIPINLTVGVVNKLTWMYVAQFLASCASLFWTPAKDAVVPNLVPPDKLESANQLSLVATYGTAPIAGFVFSILAKVSGGLGSISHYFRTDPVNLALYFNVATFVVSALTVFTLREISGKRDRGHISAPSVAKTIWEGWRFIGRNTVVRGIIIGMIGAFAAAGVVVGLGRTYISNTLHGGDAGWGVVFSAIFVGLAIGLLGGLRMLKGFSRRRLFGLMIAFAGVPLLALVGLIPNLVVVTVLVTLLGACSGIAYVTGYTIVGLEVDDDTRGRTFAFLQSAIRAIMFAVIAVAPLLAAGITAAARGITGSGTVTIGHVVYNGVGYNVVVLLGAAVALLLGISSYRHMDDRPGMPLLADLVAAVRGQPAPEPSDAGATPARGRSGRRWRPLSGARTRPFANGPGGRGSLAASQRGPGAGTSRRGLLLALEGGEGVGKTTQARLLAIWLRDQGFDVEQTQEPGGTKVGMRLRALLLDTAHAGLGPRTEALMYAADRAEHIASVVRPALERGAIVVTDRYVDSSLAYQGAGRQLPAAEVAGLNEWATGGLLPDLTILLDLPPAEGLRRRARSADRLEAEPVEFHDRVRSGFTALARASPDRYLVLDATRDAGALAKEIQERVRRILPDPVPEAAEETTGDFPVVRE